jgi:hypothetical protein
LGPDLPALDIIGATQRVSAQVIVLGIRLVTETTAEEVSAVAAAMPKDGELWVAGASTAISTLRNCLGRLS